MKQVCECLRSKQPISSTVSLGTVVHKRRWSLTKRNSQD